MTVAIKDGRTVEVSTTPLSDRVTSVFAAQSAARWKWRYDVELRVLRLAGGVPHNADVAEGWLKTKLASGDDLIRAQVAETMIETGSDLDEAVESVKASRHLVGFKRDAMGLFIEGRHIKAMLKENANSTWPKERWGSANKGSRGFVAEHVFCTDERVYLHAAPEAGQDASDRVLGPDDATVEQTFVSTFRGQGIKLQEVVPECVVRFEIVTDYDFAGGKPAERERDFWPTLWVGAQLNGLGANRSQGNGQFVVTRFALQE